MFNETIDYTISGDKHHLEEFEQFGIESIMCRSLCGADDYANNRYRQMKLRKEALYIT